MMGPPGPIAAVPLSAIQTAMITATGSGSATGDASVTYVVTSAAPITATGIIITQGSNIVYKAGPPDAGTQTISFNTGNGNTPFTVYAFITSAVGTIYSDSAAGTSAA